jgi:hypothetical protein
MTFNEQNLYWNEGFLKQPNHQRVVRLLREMQYASHAERRSVDQGLENDRRAKHSVLAWWTEKLRLAIH